MVAYVPPRNRAGGVRGGRIQGGGGLRRTGRAVGSQPIQLPVSVPVGRRRVTAKGGRGVPPSLMAGLRLASTTSGKEEDDGRYSTPMEEGEEFANDPAAAGGASLRLEPS